MTTELPPAGVSVAGKQYPLEEDNSVWWAAEIETSYTDNYATMYQAFRAHIPALPPELLSTEFPALLLQESRAALVWRVLFETGAAHPAALGTVLWEAAASKPALLTRGTHRSAIALLAATYPQLPSASREQAEQTWLNWDFSSYPDSVAVRTLTLGALFTAIGEAHLVTEKRPRLPARCRSNEPLAR